MLMNKIKKILDPNDDYVYKEIKVLKISIYIIFSEVLTDSVYINDFILRRIINITNKSNLTNLQDILPDTTVLNIKEQDIIKYLNTGFAVVIYKNIITAIEAKAHLDRGVAFADSELSIKGPKDAFSENFNTNLGLIKRRIKCSSLHRDTLFIGKHTNTKVGVLYISDIVDKSIVDEVNKKLNNIDIDGIIDSTYLKSVLESSQNNFFPTIITTQRPDKASSALLDGKVVIIVDMSPYVIILPNFFMDFFHPTDDYYQKAINTSFIRILRLIAFLIAIFLPAYYIAITTHNQSAIATKLLLNLKAQQLLSPFPSFLEVILMTLSFEILKESDIRMSSTTGSAISILGGLILGDALVSAGIISPIIIIIVAISSISGLIFNDIELVNAIRWERLILIVLSTFLGMYGIYLGFILLLINLVSLRSFQRSYLFPFSPFNKDSFKDSLIKINNLTLVKKNSLLTKNIIRGKYK